MSIIQVENLGEELQEEQLEALERRSRNGSG